MHVKILGPGCPRCERLERKIRNLAAAHQLALDIEKVTDHEAMASYGIMMTPGPVIDGEVKSSGSVPKEKQLVEWLKGEKQG
ncbi:MAG TPA: thioredoxin family protein [bacterium]|nr:thioredoxin family protein [bacterium]